MGKNQIENTPANNAKLDCIAKLENKALALGVKVPKRKLKDKIDLSVRIMELGLLIQDARLEEIKAMNMDQLRTRYTKLVAIAQSSRIPPDPFSLELIDALNPNPNHFLDLNLEQLRDRVISLQTSIDRVNWSS